VKPHEAILSLGSNQGDRLAWLNKAGDALNALPDVRITAHSLVYETEPVGVPPAFGGLLFLNCVVIVATGLSPVPFSDAVHAIEDRLGRARGGTPNLPRTIDIDILAFDDLRIASPSLTLPHPRARERRFVLQPLVDLRPSFVFPGDTQTVSDLLESLPLQPRVLRYPKSAVSAR
jgi:2-amino-4-hydroxy-6-hydroxymethyldihydropteridine diphosphokinase